MTTAKRVRKSPEERRADVYGAARSIALESGLSAVTQRAVAERAGVAPALVTHYVSRMELLVAEIFHDIAREELESVRASVEAVEGGDIERVLALLHGLIRDYRRDVALVWLDGWSLSLLIGQVLRRYLGQALPNPGRYRDYLDWLTATLSRAAEGGLDMTEVMALGIPARFSSLAVVQEEFIRSVAHLYPKIEQSVLIKIN